MNLSLFVLRIGLVFGGIIWAICLIEARQAFKTKRMVIWLLAGLPFSYLIAIVYWMLVGWAFYANGQLLVHDGLEFIMLRHWWLPVLSFFSYAAYAAGSTIYSSKYKRSPPVDE